MNHLPMIFKMKRLLRYHSRNLGLSYSCDLLIIGYEKANSQNENGKVFDYPESLEIKIENRSNWFFSVRISDGRWIREGSNLSGQGRTIGQVYRLMLRELKMHAAEIARRSNETKGA